MMLEIMFFPSLNRLRKFVCLGITGLKLYFKLRSINLVQVFKIKADIYEERDVYVVMYIRNSVNKYINVILFVSLSFSIRVPAEVARGILKFINDQCWPIRAGARFRRRLRFLGRLVHYIIFSCQSLK